MVDVSLMVDPSCASCQEDSFWVPYWKVWVVLFFSCCWRGRFLSHIIPGGMAALGCILVVMSLSGRLFSLAYHTKRSVWQGIGLRWNSLFERAVALAYHTKSNGSPGMLWVLGVLGGGKFDLINTCHVTVVICGC